MADSLPSWFQTVKAAMAAQRVPTGVWLPILIAESRGNATIVNRSKGPNPGDRYEESVGLFQLNRLGGQGVGYTVEQLQNPAINAEIAARYIGPAVQMCGPNDLACIAVNSGHPGPVNVNDPRVRKIVGIGNAVASAANDLDAWLKSLMGQPAPNETDPQPGGGGSGGGGGLAQTVAEAIGKAFGPEAMADGLARLFGFPSPVDVGWALVFGFTGVTCCIIGLSQMAKSTGIPQAIGQGVMVAATSGASAAGAAAGAARGASVRTVAPAPAQLIQPLDASFKVVTRGRKSLPTPADLDMVTP